MTNSLYELICKLDNYGYKFSFNFHGKEEDKYNTFIGGIASIMMYSLLLAIFGI